MGHKHIVKKCGDCKGIKAVEAFYRGTGTKGRDGYCKECRRARDLVRQTNKAPTGTLDARRDRKLRAMYGITLAEYDAMAAAQNYCCALCGSEERRKCYGERPRLVVDHNHATGAVRSLLCTACNGRLSAIEDEQFMLLARQYLRQRDGFEFVDDRRGQEITKSPSPDYIEAALEVQAWIREFQHQQSAMDRQEIKA